MTPKDYQRIPKWLRGEFRNYLSHPWEMDCQFMKDLQIVMQSKRVSPINNVGFYLALTLINQNQRIINHEELISDLQHQVLTLKTEIRELKKKRKA